MARQVLLTKWKVINFAAPSVAANFRKVCSFRLQNNFLTVYDILVSFSDLTNPPVQYSIHVENARS